ncbi:hypothetical protein PILCRDRAFT_293263 [Piloderma croceum F 1598]|uniref:Protein kinase domain-containing protein n=1 Tax=Piloderma croceum (strain F 1598) TaxID=765440 RepID=A0A0C3FS76_PILCF|nr:hypothetical protein PILCRDRAFT_293263 [Piloderma croceum F 1598]
MDPSTGDIILVAIKLLRGIHTSTETLESTIRRLNRESRVWHSLCHPNILPFLGLCRDMGPSPAMISPLCHNGDIHPYLATNPDADRLEIIIGVARGVQYLHSRNIIHGRLKGSNVLIDDIGTPLLSDFGSSKIVDHRGFTTSFQGAARYMAPELMTADEDVDEDEYDGAINPTMMTDVYAFAMLSLEIMTGKRPFSYLRQDTTVVAFVLDGRRPERSRCLPTIFTDPMWMLLEACWDQKPLNRPDIYTVVNQLESLNGSLSSSKTSDPQLSTQDKVAVPSTSVRQPL